MDQHLTSGEGNSRNGYGGKTVLTGTGKACPREGVRSRKIGQSFFWGSVSEAFESGAIIVMNEAVEKGVAIGM